MSLEVLVVGSKAHLTVPFSSKIRLRECRETRHYAKKGGSATHLAEFVEDELLAK